MTFETEAVEVRKRAGPGLVITRVDNWQHKVKFLRAGDLGSGNRF